MNGTILLPLKYHFILHLYIYRPDLQESDYEYENLKKSISNSIAFGILTKTAWLKSAKISKNKGIHYTKSYYELCSAHKNLHRLY